MNPLSLLGSKTLRWAVGGVAAVTLLTLGIWHYNALVTERATLRTQLEQTESVNDRLRREVTIVDREAKATVERHDFSASIKKEIHEVSPTGVPDDIRTALERLRDRP